MKEINSRILLVEDEEADIELITNALQQFQMINGMDVAKDGEQALNYLFRRAEYAQRESADPVLVLLDLKMPKVNGIEVLQAMKSDSNLKTIPVVIVTSSRENPDIRTCYELGVNAYVVKPVDFREFTEAIRNVGLFWLLVNQIPKLN